MGSNGEDSVIGIVFGIPYTAQLDENTNFLTCDRITASRKMSPSCKLFLKYFCGTRTDSPT